MTPAAPPKHPGQGGDYVASMPPQTGAAAILRD